MNRVSIHNLTDCRRRPAFTLVELLVVIGIIILILAFAVPGLSGMSRDMKLKDAEQKINNMLTAAKYHAMSNNCLVAVRFFPGSWDGQPDTDSNVPQNRQHIALYQWGATTIDQGGDPAGPAVLAGPIERFERINSIESTALPNDVWVTPLEAVDVKDPGGSNNSDKEDLSNWMLEGDFPIPGEEHGQGKDSIRGFSCGAYQRDNGFCNADDFLIVFNSEGKLVSSLFPAGLWGFDDSPSSSDGEAVGFRMQAYTPQYQREVEFEPSGSSYDADKPFSRLNFAGVVVYEREAYVKKSEAVSESDEAETRRTHLIETGRPYFVHPSSALLMKAATDRAAAGK